MCPETAADIATANMSTAVRIGSETLQLLLLTRRLQPISTVPDLSGSGRVDMLTRPVAAARAAVATGALG